MKGPTGLDILLLLVSLPAAAPAALLGGIVFAPPRPEDRERRWAIGFALAGAAACAYHFVATPQGLALYVAPAIGIGIGARIILERRARRSREASARDSGAIEKLIQRDREASGA